MKLFKGSIEKRKESFRAVTRIGGKKHTATFPTKAQAVAWLVDKSRGADSMTMDQLRDAAYALTLLPENVTLTQAAEAYLKIEAQRPTTSTEFTALANAFIADREADLRPTTLSNYRRVLNNALRYFSHLAAITPETLRKWTGTMKPHPKNTTLRALSAFFSWLMEHDYASTNPCAKIKLSRTDAPTRAVLSLEDAQHLLDTARDRFPHLIPYVAICMFAGVRPDECKQLTSAEVGADYIRIAEGKSKTHAARTVPIRDNLRDILSRYPVPEKGMTNGLSPDRFKKHMTALIKASGIEWATDILRHSYASYEYELTKDAAATAANLGHTNTTMLFRHYRGLVNPGTGKQYFQITL